MKKVRKMTAVLLAVVMLALMIPVATVTVSAGSVIESAISWAVDIASRDDLHGYSQTSRWGPDYDCSSLVITAFNNAGVSTGSATYTGNMISNFETNGFTWIPWSSIGNSSNLQRGDILLNIQYHTAIYMGNNEVVEAHARSAADKAYDSRPVYQAATLQGDQDGQEIRVTSYYWYSSGGWDGVLRYKDEPDDHDGPSADNFRVDEIQSNQFTVYAHVTDPSGINSVRYAVWTENNGQDDIVWYDGHCTDGNDYYWARINFSTHNNETGRYIIHMYAYDNCGNLTNPGISYDFNSNGPSFTDFHVGELRDGAFTILAKVTDTNGVSLVKYAVWTEKNGQDDIKWYTGHCTDNNDYYWSRINLSDHNNERGTYIIHMYAYDVAGKLTNPGITYYFPENGPTITDVEVSCISSTGYTVSCKVSSEIGVSRVQFPSWTEKNDQDDIASEWWTNPEVRGTINGDTVTFRVETSKHNNETGTYKTHIYAYDTLGTSSVFVVTNINVKADNAPPSCDSYWIDNVTNDTYRVNAIPKDNEGIKCVQIATWTQANQSDIIWHDAINNGNGIYYVDIKRSDYSKYSNSFYNNHIYIYDYENNYICVECNQNYKINSETGKSVSEGDYRIVTAVNENRALDVANASADSGANIQIYNNFISPKQTFKLVYQNNGFYTISNNYSNCLLDVAGDTYLNNTNVIQCDANGGANQQWMIMPTGNDDGYYYIISRSNGLALDVTNAKDEDGANVAVHTQNQTTAQKWKLRRVLNQDMVKIKSWKLVNGIMKPNVKVTVDDNVLIENTDYTVSSYVENNKLYANITGIGNYCDSVSVEYQEIKYNIGDVNGDNSVDVLDATLIQKYTVDKAELTDEQVAAADVNNDNVVDILDATDIQKFSVDKITDFKRQTA